MMRTAAREQRGISLIEAVVAMAIMAVGMLGMLGIQATLRANSDIAKQRSEAVRIAQATMETRRAFSVLGAASGATAYADIQSAVEADVVLADPNTNTTFRREEVVSVFPATSDRDHVAAHKSVKIEVSWRDRTNERQFVRLSSIVAGSTPDIAAALAVPATGSPVQSVRGRNRVIPSSAVDQTGDNAGTSRFTPPGAASGVSWIFNNSSGLITQTCVFTACTDVTARVVSGYVRFAASAAPPTTADAVVPPDPTPLSGVGVIVTLSDATSTVVDCFESNPSGTAYISYYCAVAVDTVTAAWSGQSTVTGLPLASDASDATGTRYRVCRYTAARLNTATTPAVPNPDHPYRYSAVDGGLTNQNFLIIAAGNGSTPYSCPDDSGLLGRTFAHQPAS